MSILSKSTRVGFPIFKLISWGIWGSLPCIVFTIMILTKATAWLYGEMMLISFAPFLIWGCFVLYFSYLGLYLRRGFWYGLSLMFYGLSVLSIAFTSLTLSVSLVSYANFWLSIVSNFRFHQAVYYLIYIPGILAGVCLIVAACQYFTKLSRSDWENDSPYDARRPMHGLDGFWRAISESFAALTKSSAGRQDNHRRASYGESRREQEPPARHHHAHAYHERPAEIHGAAGDDSAYSIPIDGLSSDDSPLSGTKPVESVGRYRGGAGVLLFVGSFNQGEEYPVSGDRDLLIGRDASRCNIVLPEDSSSISRVHCQIHYSHSKGAVVIRDLGSTNGTFLNDSRLEPKQWYHLNIGDRVVLGSRTYSFRFSN